MFVQVEETPNPNTIKFLPGQALLTPGEPPLRFVGMEETVHAPFASRLMDIDGVEEVLFGYDFISVTKNAAHNWAHLKPFLFHAIIECLTRNIPLIGDLAPSSSREAISIPNFEAYDAQTQRIVQDIVQTLDAHIRPAVARDGGDVQFVRYAEGAVYLSMRGACAGCPSAQMTLKSGIERTLKYYVPQVQSVYEETVYVG